MGYLVHGVALPELGQGLFLVERECKVGQGHVCVYVCVCVCVVE